jgi:hypothetical protein
MNNSGKYIDNRLKPKWLPQMEAPKDYILNELSREGIVYKEENVDPTSLTPLQGYVDKAKAQMFMDMIDKNEEIPYPFISADNGILDGHHRAFAFTKHPHVKGCTAIKIYLPNEDAARVLNKIQDRYGFEQELAAGGRGMMIPFGGDPEETSNPHPAMGGDSQPDMGDEHPDLNGGEFGEPSFAKDPNFDRLVNADRGQVEYNSPVEEPVMDATPTITPDHIAGIRDRMATLAGTKKGAELGVNTSSTYDTADKTPNDDTDFEIKEMEVVSSDNDGQEIQSEPNANSMEDEPLPIDTKASETESEPEIVSYDSATKNEQSRVVFKTKPINTKAKTGDFLILTQKDGFKYKYELQFENLLEITNDELHGLDYPTEAPLIKWQEGSTPESLKAKAKESALTYELYLSRTVNQEAKRKGYDGIQYGDKFVQIINDVN